MKSDGIQKESDFNDNHNEFRVVVVLLQSAIFYPLATLHAVLFNL
jgi:hypothetical protein